VREEDRVRLHKYRNVYFLFQCYATVYWYITVTRILTVQESEFCTEKCHQFMREFRAVFPNERVTPKMHFLSVEIPRFLRQFRTVGLLSEQNVESFHAHVNRLRRQYATVYAPHARYKLIFQAAALAFSPQIAAYQPPQRVCPRCHLPSANANRFIANAKSWKAPNLPCNSGSHIHT
jgi:hypothetical protein